MKYLQSLVLTLMLFLSLISAKEHVPGPLAVIFNNGSISSDMINRLVSNLKLIQIDSLEFHFKQSYGLYREWMVKSLIQSLSTASKKYKNVLLIDSVAMLVGKDAVNNLNTLNTKKISTFTCPKQLCNNITETCTDVTSKSFPSVYFGSIDNIIKVFKDYQNDAHGIHEDSFGIEHQNLFNHENGPWIMLADSPLNTTDIDNTTNMYKMKNAQFIVACSNNNQTMFLNQISNYIKESGQCFSCKGNDNISKQVDNEPLPNVGIALLIEDFTPFLEQHLENVLNFTYDKSKIDLLIHNKMDYHNATITEFIVRALPQYRSLKHIASMDDITENEAKIDAIKYCFDHKEIEFLFVVTSTALLEKSDILENLIRFNLSVVAPLLTRQYSFWSNFWGSVSDTGFYNRSFDYLSIVKREITGIWNVPHIMDCYLLNRISIQKLHNKRITGDADLGFANLLRKEGMFMFVSNLDVYGKLTNNENYNISLPKPDLYQIFDNYDQWTDKYIHPDVWSMLDGNRMPKEPLTDTYYFPFTTHAFCDDLVATAVASNAWSGGKNQDPRIPGGYENVPTDDVHMTQIGFSESWHVVLQNFIMPIQRKLFQGYTKEPPSAPLSFVVRYHPEKQDRLKPHHDSSTYTLNIALNQANVDYEGGGVRFIRYHTIVKDIKKGWLLIHPGRLTHLHEGLPTTNGTRFIFVSFVDP